MVEITDAPLSGLKIMRLTVHGDSRGFFVERYHEENFRAAGLPAAFPQDNHSRSAPGVLRGLHFQPAPPQGKLVGCVRGRIWDVAVDVRPDSPSFGRHFGLELSDTNGTLLWIPPGFAHGFCVLGSEPADVLYKVSALYNPRGETGIAWNDPDLAVAWPLAGMALQDGKPVTSARDGQLPSFREYRSGTADT